MNDSLRLNFLIKTGGCVVSTALGYYVESSLLGLLTPNDVFYEDSREAIDAAIKHHEANE